MKSTIFDYWPQQIKTCTSHSISVDERSSSYGLSHPCDLANAPNAPCSEMEKHFKDIWGYNRREQREKSYSHWQKFFCGQKQPNASQLLSLLPNPQNPCPCFKPDSSISFLTISQVSICLPRATIPSAPKAFSIALCFLSLLLPLPP